MQGHCAAKKVCLGKPMNCIGETMCGWSSWQRNLQSWGGTNHCVLTQEDMNYRKVYFQTTLKCDTPSQQGGKDYLVGFVGMRVVIRVSLNTEHDAVCEQPICIPGVMDADMLQPASRNTTLDFKCERFFLNLDSMCACTSVQNVSALNVLLCALTLSLSFWKVVLAEIEIWSHQASVGDMLKSPRRYVPAGCKYCPTSNLSQSLGHHRQKFPVPQAPPKMADKASLSHFILDRKYFKICGSCVKAHMQDKREIAGQWMGAGLTDHHAEASASGHNAPHNWLSPAAYWRGSDLAYWKSTFVQEADR